MFVGIQVVSRVTNFTSVTVFAGADVKALNLNKDSALHRAAWRNARKSIRLLLDAGADIFKEAKNADGKTPVDLARDVETRALVAPKIVDAGTFLLDRFCIALFALFSADL